MVEVVEGRSGLRAKIRSEDDAWELLRRIVDEEFDDEQIDVKFVGWPDFHIKFWVGNEQRVLTAPMMEGLLSYQSSLNRAFLLIEEGTTNLRSLSEEDRRTQEFKFKVRAGSTDIEPNFTDILKEFAKSAGAHMTGRDVVIVVIAVALIWASVAAFRAWLDYKSKTAQDDTSSQNIKSILQAGRVASEADVEKMGLMVRALESAMGNRVLLETGDEGKEGLLPAASKVDDSEIAGVNIAPETARRVVRNTRTNPSRSQVTSTFTVVRTDPEFSGGFRVKVRNEQNGEEFFATLRDAMLSEEDRLVIMNSEWSGVPFHATIALLRHRGEITSAEIVAVSAPDADSA